MKYNYDGLWKILADKGLTKTEMRKQADISTNILAKMGKGEAVAMDSIAKIALLFNCSFDDIVKLAEETSPTDIKCNNTMVSQATMRNWQKLKTDGNERLTTRANKRKSLKRILPLEYFTNKDNIVFIKNFLDFTDSKKYDIASVIVSLGINLLIKANIYGKNHVKKVLHDFSNISMIKELIDIDLPDDEADILGLIYQSFLSEGKKNIIGSYYTPKNVVNNMITSFNFDNHEEILDPCCGSGAFLLAVNAENPKQLYGIDNDRLAVFIAKVNLLLKYADQEFDPQIYYLDYLTAENLLQQHDIFSKKFDYIVTNPPWGAMVKFKGCCNDIISGETFSYFFVQAFYQLKVNGVIRFLFPEAILNVKLHKDIRKFIIEKTGLKSITLYNDMFSSVTTKYVDIECTKQKDNDEFAVSNGNTTKCVALKTVYETEGFVFNLLNNEDLTIIKKVKEKGKYFLKNSTWALGIVTGDNKNKLFAQPQNGMEKIYTGKDIKEYVLEPAKKYILYNRNTLQQVAKDEIYRAPEKLVYKFISKKLTFAYDDTGSLFLNSANILIPVIPQMSVKTVMAFLNSVLFKYVYIKLFGEVKVLKGNLNELPFPKISSEEDLFISGLVDKIIAGDKNVEESIDRYILSLYAFNDEQIIYIRSVVNGKAD